MRGVGRGARVGRGLVAALVAGAWAGRALGDRPEVAAVLQESAAAGVRVVTRVDRREIMTVESLELTIEVRASAGASVVGLDPDPVVGGELGGFTVAWVRASAPAVDAGDVVRRWVVGLEPFLAGEATIPPLGVKIDGRERGGVVVPSEAIVVRVTSVLEGVEGFEAGAVRAPLEPEAVRVGDAGVAGWVWGAACGVVGMGVVWGMVAVASRGKARRHEVRAWRRLRQRADAAVAARGVGAGVEGVEVLRAATALVIGERGRAMSSEELGEWLRKTGATGDGAGVDRLLRWGDARAYGGVEVDPPSMPELVGVVRALEGVALERAAGGARG